MNDPYCLLISLSEVWRTREQLLQLLILLLSVITLDIMMVNTWYKLWFLLIENMGIEMQILLTFANYGASVENYPLCLKNF